MRMSLEKMVIENFKGTRKLIIDFSEETHIFGMNGTGKTTIPDAFSWVLFNKDSKGNAPGSDNFREKPLDEDGHEIHNLDTMVELDCKLDGQRFNLKRRQSENWVKKRGSKNPVFQGNVSTYWINDVETKLTDFKARIAEIAPEEIFRLIGTLAAFNTQDWKKRRAQLLALTGGEVDSRLLAKSEYRPLADECGTRNISTDDLRKVLMDQRKRTGDELKMIPVRIDEAKKALPVFGKDEIETAEYILKDNAKDIERLDNLIAEEKAFGERQNNGTQIAALEQEAASITRQMMSEFTEKKRGIESRMNYASADAKRYDETIKSCENRKVLLDKQKTAAEARMVSIRAEYKALYETVFGWNTKNNVCPTCGQALPEDQVAEKKAEAEKKFMADKIERLNRMKAEGIEKKKEVEQVVEFLKALDMEIEQTKAKLEAAEKELAAAKAELDEYPVSPDFDSNPRLAEIRAEIRKLQEAAEKVIKPDTSGYESRKAALLAQMEEKRAILARRDAGIETEKRIKVLEEQQEAKGAEMAELERMIALAERFVTERCSALEDSINACFPTVRWKLFDIQINGGIADVCNCMIPCESGLVAYNSANTAAQLAADVEIINVLSKYYDVYIPLFIDNAERINVIPETESQKITLSVSTDAELTKREVA